MAGRIDIRKMMREARAEFRASSSLTPRQIKDAAVSEKRNKAAQAAREKKRAEKERAQPKQTDMGEEEIIQRLRARTVRNLPSNWKEGRKCPQCNVGADRPKCYYDLGAACPRHDPDSYEPSPYVEIPDKLCHDAAQAIEYWMSQSDGG